MQFLSSYISTFRQQYLTFDAFFVNITHLSRYYTNLKKDHRKNVLDEYGFTLEKDIKQNNRIRDRILKPIANSLKAIYFNKI